MEKSRVERIAATSAGLLPIGHVAAIGDVAAIGGIAVIVELPRAARVG